MAPGVWMNGNANVCWVWELTSSSRTFAMAMCCWIASWESNAATRMSDLPSLLDLKKLKVYPLAERRSLSQVENVLVEPSGNPAPAGEAVRPIIQDCARHILAARNRRATVMLIYGAHFVKNGGQLLLNQL